MKIISLLFITVFAGWGISIVKNDLEFQKIPNKKIILGMKFFALFFLAMGFNTYLGYAGRVDSFLNMNFYGFWLIHLGWVFLAAIILWYGEIWPAGDAKFFILASACLPLINPFIANFPSYLFLRMLINTFIVAAFFAFANYISSGMKDVSPADFFKSQWTDIKTRFSTLVKYDGAERFLLIIYVINISLIFLLQQIFASELKDVFGGLIARTEIIYFVLFFMWDKIGHNFRSRKWLYISIAAYAVYFIMGYFLFPYRLVELLMISLMNVVKFGGILFVGRFMLEFIMEKKDTSFVESNELEPKMVLSSGTLKMLRDNPVFEGAFDDCFKDGITAEQVDVLKEWLTRLKMERPKIEITKGRPFALWIFAGAIITLIFDKNILVLIGVFK